MHLSNYFWNKLPSSSAAVGPLPLQFIDLVWNWLKLIKLSFSGSSSAHTHTGDSLLILSWIISSLLKSEILNELGSVAGQRTNSHIQNSSNTQGPPVYPEIVSFFILMRLQINIFFILLKIKYLLFRTKFYIVLFYELIKK